MNITVIGKDIEVTAALREYVNTKLQRTVMHYPDVTSLRVTLSVDNEKEKDRRNHVSINFHQPGKESHISAESQDMYASIDDLMRKLTTFLERQKSRHLEHSHESPRTLAAG